MGARRLAWGTRRLACSAVAAKEAKESEAIERLLRAAKRRKAAEASAAAAAAAAAEPATKPALYIHAHDPVDPRNLQHLARSEYSYQLCDPSTSRSPHAVLLRSHRLTATEVPQSVRAVAVIGEDTSTVPVHELSRRGVPVFTTPGADANAVKELTLCGLLLASRGVIEGIEHVQRVAAEADLDHASMVTRVERDKARFAGREIAGKTLAICGLGPAGAAVAVMATSLGMHVVGFDPSVSVDAAWRLPHGLQRTASLHEAAAGADFLSIHDPANREAFRSILDPFHDDMTHVVSSTLLAAMRPSCHLLNFSGSWMVDSRALADFWAACTLRGQPTGKYVSDHYDAHLHGHPAFICLPALGGATHEAADSRERMAASQVSAFLEAGTVANSPNFPATSLGPLAASHTRLCIINVNRPGMLGIITSLLGSRELNISQQINTSRGEIAYTLIDLARSSPAVAERVERVTAALHRFDGVLSTRLIHSPATAGLPAAGSLAAETGGEADADFKVKDLSRTSADEIIRRLLEERGRPAAATAVARGAVARGKLA